MWESIKIVLKGFLGSKKAVAVGVGAVVALAARLGLPEEVAAEVAGGIVALVSFYVLGQGAADFGKEAKKVETGTPK